MKYAIKYDIGARPSCRPGRPARLFFIGPRPAARRPGLNGARGRQAAFHTRSIFAAKR